MVAGRITFAERAGRLVSITHVPAGRACGCVCPACGAALIARKGHIKRHHFAHATPTACLGETVLHEVGKRLLHARITRHLRRGRPLPVGWRCAVCRDWHDGDLLRRARHVFMEERLSDCRPDLLLLDADRRPVAVLEIIVSHAPDAATLATCRQSGVALVTFRLRTSRDLARLDRAPELHPASVDLCLRPRCTHCHHRLRARDLHIAEGACWRCGQPMRLALVMLDHVYLEGPDTFTTDELITARAHGARIAARSTQAARSVLANTCPTCGVRTGPAYLVDFAPAHVVSPRASRSYVCPNGCPSPLQPATFGASQSHKEGATVGESSRSIA
jgi:hypothetical protein